MTAKIYGSRDGNLLGTIEHFDIVRYENACHNPEGHCRAGDVLDDEDLAAISISAETSIYALIA